MIEFLKNNIGTVVVGAILLLLCIYVFYVLIRNRRQGKTSCGCNCGGCPMSGTCHKQEKEKDP